MSVSTSGRLRARISGFLVAVVASGLLIATPASADTVTAADLPTLLRSAAETTTPAYNRDRFEHWIDADADGCNTRYEVLIEESLTAVTVGSGCSLTGGTWLSVLDGAPASSPTEVEIDHLVALAEAWRSGASSWTDEQRRAFANDLDVPYALHAVSSASNQSKADKDPAEWLPSNVDFRCEYAISWSLVKYRWSLAADPAEIAALAGLFVDECGATEVTLPTVMIADEPAPDPDPDPAPEPDPGPQTVISGFPNGLTRLAGSNRYITATELSKRYAPDVPAVFVATGTNFPDALAASAAAALVGGPLLLTPTASLPVEVRTEIERLKPRKIYILGNTGAVSDAVASTLSGIAPVERVGGPNRYETGLGIVNATFSSAETAFIATGRTFPDALAATGAAGAQGAPVILVDGMGTTVPSSTLATLQRLGVQSVAIAGASGAVSNGIANQLSSAGYAVSRFGGADRYETAALINNAFFSSASSDTMFLSTGTNFPDGLAGGAVAGRLGAPLYVTDGTCVPPAVRSSIINLAPVKRVVLGSEPTVSDAAAANLGCLSSPVPAISGTVRVANTLTAIAGTWSPGTSLSYRWLASGAVVGTGTSLALTSAHQGKTITVQVTGSLSGYATVTRVSKATAAVAPGTLTSSVPTISGTLEVGAVLTANPGVWTSGAALSYQWYANGVAAGIGRTLTLTSSHQGKGMTVRVTGTLAGYTSVARTSAATSAVKAAPPRYSGYVTAGAFCAKEYAGWIGYTVTGVKMMCKTSATDTRLRWRAV